MNIFKIALFVFSLGLTQVSFAQDKGTESAGSKKPKKETKFTEVVNTDSLPSSELLKRAVNWVKLEINLFDKTNGVTTATKAECIATFTIKPKELNPPCDYTGVINLKVSIECKDNKYKYTVNQIKHVSKSGKTSGGSIDNVVPECGSMIMNDNTWKKIRGEGVKCAERVVNDLKEQMKKDSKGAGDEW